MQSECTICEFKNEIDNKEKMSIKCVNCKALLNLNVKKYDYFNEGGQDIPDDKKKNERKKNSDLRFKIIKKFLNSPYLFIDIGSGSGEMLEASRNYFDNHLGYEHDKKLCEYSKSNDLNVINRDFDIKDLQFFDFSKKNNEVLTSFCHVVEHSAKPIELINSVINQIKQSQIIYIEVPLYTGFDFNYNKYKSKLWYDQHYALYHIDTLKYLAQKTNLKILDIGCRTFFSDRFQKKNLLKVFIKKPLSSIFNIIKNYNKLTIADNLFKNYGYIILKNK